MITPYSQSKFIRKNITNSIGEVFSVLFLVTLVNGEVKAQIISAKQISTIPRLTGEVKGDTSNFLPIFCNKIACDAEYTSESVSKISPYIELFFFNSQPTRAPAFVR
jgi:hypothetical protein